MRPPLPHPLPICPPAVGWPDCASTPEERSMLVKELHLLKTALFNQAVVDGEIPLRKGVMRLVDEAVYKKVPLVRGTSRERTAPESSVREWLCCFTLL